MSEGAAATSITVTAALGSTALTTVGHIGHGEPDGGDGHLRDGLPGRQQRSTSPSRRRPDLRDSDAVLRPDRRRPWRRAAKTVVLTASATGSLTSGAATLTITDNDTAPTAVTLSLNPNSVSEGAAATSITVTASLGSTALTTATTVSVSRTGGTATSGEDYPAISAFNVTIAANATSGTATLSFDPTEDILAEGSETVVLTAASGSLTSATATLTITDNDTAPSALSCPSRPPRCWKARARPTSR